MDGIDAFLDVKCCLLSKGNSVGGKNRRIVGMVAVVGSKDFEVILVSRLRHKEGKERGVFILFQNYLFVNNHVFIFGIACLIMTYCCRISDSLR